MLYFTDKIIKVDMEKGRPLWQFIYAFSAEGTKQRFLQRVFTFRNEQIYATSSSLWLYTDVANAIKNLKSDNNDNKEEAKVFLINNLQQFAFALTNVNKADISIVDEEIYITLDFFDEKNKNQQLKFTLSSVFLKKRMVKV